MKRISDCETYNPESQNAPTFKAIITGDWHFRGTNPRARTDNFQEALIEKLLEVFQLARLHKADAIICPGDILDSPNTAWGTVSALIRVIKAAPCPILTIHGNHDIWSGNPGSKYRTPYGLLSSTGFLWDVEEQEYCEGGSGGNDASGGVVVTGCGFDVNTDTRTDEGAAQFWPETPDHYFKGTFHIHLVHSMLLDKPPGFEGMRHTLISQVKTSAHVIISGHEHTGFGIIQRDPDADGGTLFINPGALCRLSAHESEMERTIGVALLTVKGGQASAELIPLKSARPGHEVLSREHIESAQEREGRIGEFLRLLAAEGEAKFLEVREILEDIVAREQLPEAVKMEALRRVGVAREALLGVGNDEQQRR